jgi:2-dehydropantoate 2-reductase
MQQRTILVVGCGAIGGLFAGALAGVADIIALDANAAHVDAINRDGLHIAGLGTARIRATIDAASLVGRHIDAALFLVKSRITGVALEALAPVLTPDTLLVTLQNGMGNDTTLLARTHNPVARGVTMLAGRYDGPGQVAKLIHGRTWLGPVRGTIADVAWLADLLQACGLPTEALGEVNQAVWSKLVFNAVMNPIGALLRGVNAARYQSPEIVALIDDMAEECIAVVTALGGSFATDPMEYVRQVRAGTMPMSRHGGSMALDMARGAPSEIDELTGYIVREADRLGIAVPICRTMFRLVKGLELAVQWQIADQDKPG